MQKLIDLKPEDHFWLIEDRYQIPEIQEYRILSEPYFDDGFVMVHKFNGSVSCIRLPNDTLVALTQQEAIENKISTLRESAKQIENAINWYSNKLFLVSPLEKHQS
jgi:hypothetical protein